MTLWTLLQVCTIMLGVSEVCVPGGSCEHVADLMQGCILFVNSVAILNNDRFLEKSEYLAQTSTSASAVLGRCWHLKFCSAVGWGYSQIGSNNLAAHPNALKSQLIGGLHAVAYLRGMVYNASVACLSCVVLRCLSSEWVMQFP